MSVYGRVLVTGGRGMLAQAMARVLAGRGIAATVLSRQECDILNASSLAQLFERLQPTLVINCAAYTKVDQAEKEPDVANATNGLGPGILAELCGRHQSTLVHFSTDYVFDGTLRRPLRPDDPVGAHSAYGKSKLLGEQEIQRHRPPRWLIARTAWLYGVGGPNFVQTMVKAAQTGKPLKVVNDQVGSPTYTIDLAEATLELLDRGASGIWHVSNAGQTTWFEFAGAIFQEWGLSPDLQATTSADWKATRPDSATRPAYSVFDVTRLETLLGRPMRSWREALKAFKNELAARGGF